MRIKIWGCRGSLPAPLKPGQVEEKIVRAILGVSTHIPELDTADEAAVRGYVKGMDALSRGTAGGETTCVEIRAGETLFVIDAGTGIRDLGLELMNGPFGRGEGELHLLFSHPHWDHIQGFPFFLPAYTPGNRIFIYGVHDMEKALIDQQNYLNFPVPMSSMEADIEFITLQERAPFRVDDVQINTIRNVHPGGSYGYRIKDAHSAFVFASDAEFKHLDDAVMQPHIAFFKEADALIFDAQYTLGEGWIKEDWGHSSALIGVEMALAAGVKRLILFHHDPTNDDVVLQHILRDARGYRDELGGHEALEIMVAYEGLALDLTRAALAGASDDNHRDAHVWAPTRVFDEKSVQQVAEQMLVLDERAVPSGRIIDLSQVETLTTASLKKLVSLQNAPGQAPLVLAAPSPGVLRVIELGGFSDFFAIYPTIKAAQTAVAARRSAQLPGHVLGKRFLIERVLARGRMGTVLLAADQQTEDSVSIRIFDPAYSKETLKRLFDHRDLLLKADHPNLLSVIDLAEEKGVAYLVEQYHPGRTLDKLLEEHPEAEELSFDRKLATAQAIVAGMAYAHEQGIVHGNLKDDKIYIDGDWIQIGGMGLGRLDEGIPLLEAPRLRQVVAYLAPEQVLGQDIDVRTDLYALGVILYQLFTGHCPFQGDEREVLQAHLNQEPLPPLSDAGDPNPADLQALILKLLAKDPADRGDSAVEVRRFLRELNPAE
jgi:phosphoribosyl 1,2-cyclic phosphodiesterase/anti-anti-sigma regulatory factor